MRHELATRLLLSAFFFSAAFVLAGQAPSDSLLKADSAPASRSLDACTLLTNQEIEAVQGESILETKSSVQPAGGLAIQQCLFRTTTSAKSVVLSVTTPGPASPSALSPRKFWQMQFHSAAKPGGETAASKGRKKDAKEADEDETEPRRIEGVGEEAYWMGNQSAGALYVLQGDIYLRISVGGARESLRMEKSKRLALAVIHRLHHTPA